MKNLLKKSCTLILLSLIALSLMMGMVACKDQTPQNKEKVMNLSLNPSVEFILDANNKVVSVSANNDEGNFIVASATFTGLTAEDAADLFLQVVKDNGFLIEGTVSANENNLKIEVSGETAQKIYNSVKDSVLDKMTELSVTVNVSDFEKITKAQIESLIEECCKELDNQEVSKMTEEKLLTLLKNSRAETKDLLSEELKDYYYQARHVEILKAKFAKIEELVDLLPSTLDSVKGILSNAKQELIGALEALNQAYEDAFLAETGSYRVAMDNFIREKKALLEGRLNSFESATKVELESALATAELALNNAKSVAEGLVNTANVSAQNALNAIESAITTILSFIDFDKVNQSIETAKAQFAQDFKLEFSVQIADVYWNDLKPNEQA